MYCNKCGRELSDGARFCLSCGAEQQTEYRESTATETPEVNAEPIEEQKPAKVWTVFSTIGKILGIVAICICWIPMMYGVVLGVPGIVFSCLGRKAQTEQAEKNFKIGLTLSIIAIVFTIFSFIIYIIVVAVLQLGSQVAWLEWWSSFMQGAME